SATVASACTLHLQRQYTSLSSSGWAADGASVTSSVPVALGVKLRTAALKPGLVNRSLIGLPITHGSSRGATPTCSPLARTFAPGGWVVMDSVTSDPSAAAGGFGASVAGAGGAASAAGMAGFGASAGGGGGLGASAAATVFGVSAGGLGASAAATVVGVAAGGVGASAAAVFGVSADAGAAVAGAGGVMDAGLGGRRAASIGAYCSSFP